MKKQDLQLAALLETRKVHLVGSAVHKSIQTIPSPPWEDMTILDYIIEGPDMSEKGLVDVAGIVDNITNEMDKWPPED